jgi:radical S-adenosyl methionine domain-containing protein 2
VIKPEQFQAFAERHKEQPSLILEDNDVMKDSYLLLDEKMWFVLLSLSLLPAIGSP